MPVSYTHLENGRDQSVADQAEQEYKKMKSDLTSERTGIVYNLSLIHI